jgi:hypothetical protein
MVPVEYEYVLLRLTDARAAHISERLNQHADEGYEPVLMCGDATLSLLLRRAKSAAPAAPAEAEA